MNLYIYDKLRDTIKTGDQIFFTGEDLTSNLIEDTTSSVFSHVGTAYWVHLVDEYPPRLMLMESTTLNSIPDWSGQVRRGVQTVMLSQKIEAASGPVWLVPLKKELSPEEKENMLEFLYQRYTSKSNYNMLGAIRAGLKNPHVPKWISLLVRPLYYLFYRKETMNKLFCSELSCKALQKANRIDEMIDARLQTPALLSKFDCFATPIKLTS